MRCPKRLALLALIGVLLGPSLAWAEQYVDDVLKQGKTALIHKRGADARVLFSEGLRLAKSEPMRWRMQLGLALALVLDDALVDAAQAYRTFLRASADHQAAKAAKWQRRRRRALEDLRSLELSLLATRAKVDLQSDPPMAKLVIDGEPAHRTTPAVVYLTAGSHRVTLELDGYQSESLSLVVEAGQQPLIHRKLTRTATEPVIVDPGPTPEGAGGEEPPTDFGASRGADTETSLDSNLENDLSHAWQPGVYARLDVDGQLRGALGAFGASFGLGDWFELGLAALLGRDKGLEPAIAVLPLSGAPKPVIQLAAPMFFVDGVRPGVRVAAGAQWDMWRHLGIFALSTISYFPSVPRTYDALVFAPALGVQGRL